MGIPDFDKDVNIQAVASQCFTRKNFEEFILKPLKLFYEKDNNGNANKESGQKTFGSYDKMYLEIEKKLNNSLQMKLLTHKRLKLFKKF